MKPKLSLKGRALQWLAQREHSRAELRTKLLRSARTDLTADRAAQGGSDPEADAVDAGHVPGDFDDRHGHSAQPVRAGLAGAGHQRPHHTSAVPGTESAASPSLEEAVDAILDWLEARHYLDEGRFIESRVNARAAKHGNLRIRHELARHGLSLSVEEAQALKESEFSRACDVWRRKFGVPPADAAERARQMRFLGGRGFSAEVIRRVVQGGAGDDD